MSKTIEQLKKEAREDFEARMLPLHEHTTQTAIDKADALVLLEKWIDRAYKLGQEDPVVAALNPIGYDEGFKKGVKDTQENISHLVEEQSKTAHESGVLAERKRCAEIARKHPCGLPAVPGSDGQVCERDGDCQYAIAQAIESEEESV